MALADRIDSLAGFFAAGEKPGGSSDPYALRRAALGVIRIIRDNALRLDLAALIKAAAAHLPGGGGASARRRCGGAPDLELLPGFIAERLRVRMRAEGARHDVLSAVNAAGADGDLMRLLARTAAVTSLLESEAGGNLLAAGKRAANILRIEEKRDGPPDPSLYVLKEDRLLAEILSAAEREIAADNPSTEDVLAFQTSLLR